MRIDQATVRFSVSLPGGLLRELDKRAIDRGYASRSEFVRDLIRKKIVEDRWRSQKRVVVGVLTICYDHHQRDLAQKVLEAQHCRYVNVLCSTHVHLDHDHCLETIIIKGRPGEIEKIALSISGLRGVRFAELTRASRVDL